MKETRQESERHEAVREEQRQEALRRQEMAREEPQHEEPKHEEPKREEPRREEPRREQPRAAQPAPSPAPVPPRQEPKIDSRALLDSSGLVMVETDRSKAAVVAPQMEEPQHLGRPRRERPKPLQQDEELQQVETRK